VIGTSTPSLPSPTRDITIEQFGGRAELGNGIHCHWDIEFSVRDPVNQISTLAVNNNGSLRADGANGTRTFVEKFLQITDGRGSDFHLFFAD
jgi:hypothetical protein